MFLRNQVKPCASDLSNAFGLGEHRGQVKMGWVIMITGGNSLKSFSFDLGAERNS